MKSKSDQPAKYQCTAIDYVIFMAVIFICLWSWIFVEPDTLQRNAAAQTIVKLVTSVLPWVAALERYGQQAHKLLLVHSVCYLVFLPLMFLYIKAQKKIRVIDLQKAVVGFLGVLLLLLLFSAIYFNLSDVFDGAVRRSKLGFMTYSWSMPILACAFAATISYLSALLLFMVVHFISMTWGNHD